MIHCMLVFSIKRGLNFNLIVGEEGDVPSWRIFTISDEISPLAYVDLVENYVYNWMLN